MYIYWFICCVYVVTYDRRGSKSACIFFWLFEREVVSLPLSFHFFGILTSLVIGCFNLWSLNFLYLFSPSLSFSLSLSLTCLSSGHIDTVCRSSEIIKPHSLIYCVLSMLSCCDNTKVCILTATHVYIECIYVCTCAIHAIWAIY